MNLNRIIKDLRGKEVKIINPSKEEIDALPKDGEGRPDLSKLPANTVRNVILDCLERYAVNDKKEVFYLNTIASLVIGADEAFELKDKLKAFLIKVIESQIYRVEENEMGKKTTKGMFFGWVVAQVLEELGVKSEILE